MTKLGRPTNYKPEYCDQIVAHMAEGASVTSFAASIGAARSTVSLWMETHPDFLEAVNIGKAACAAWWEAVSRRNAMEGGGNATLCIFGLKNMAPDEWRDKQAVEMTGESGGPIQAITEVRINVVGPRPADP